ncbi:MAG: DUF4258 domain-containing protein [Magnetococcales bacterium]|nr:DUF4258 domain-containing protein [Magnetococcales bacterium]
MNYRISKHASQEMWQRGITEDLVRTILREPHQVVEERESLVAFQSRIRFEEDRWFLIRVLVNPLVDPVVVVTVYRTSKIAKYWKKI